MVVAMTEIDVPGESTELQNYYELQYENEAAGGSLEIHPDVIARIVQQSVQFFKDEVQLHREGLLSRIGGKEERKGVLVVQEDRDSPIKITLSVEMAYLANMRELATRLQRHVKEVVERMTSQPVGQVNVRIVGMFVRHDKKEDG